MRLSCNGCRVLRKGCSGDCPIRPCLQWIKSPQSQANATLFLAKFYGRAGLINLINAAAPHLRPGAFKSLLHEACGRIVNPILGCSGLLSSGRWDLCEAALEAVLSGASITEVSSSESGSMLKACDIRHVANRGNLHKVKSRFKRSGGSGNRKRKGGIELEGWGWGSDQEWGSGVSEHGGDAADSCSVETVEAEAEAEAQPQPQPQAACGDGELDLNLTLGLGWGPLKPSLDNSRLPFVL